MILLSFGVVGSDLLLNAGELLRLDVPLSLLPLTSLLLSFCLSFDSFSVDEAFEKRNLIYRIL